jgi:arylsulfatase A-like enzyme
VGQDLVFAVSGSEHPEPTVPTNRPNILVILADDLGWTDIQTRTNFGPNYLNGTNHGSDYYQTPNIARLAHEGLSFTHCYAQPNCSPMRAATLSGQYASRSGNGVYNVDGLNRGTGTPTLVGPAQNQDVPSSTVTSAESLRAGGYVTAHFGKYHVGGHEGGTSTLPLNQGFDWNFGGGTAGNPGSYFASGGEFHSNVGPELDGWAANYDVPYVNSVLWPLATNRAPNPNNPGTLDGTAKHLGDAMADAAIAFLKDHVTGPLSHRPFYLQFHTYEVHTPIQPRPDLQAKYSGLPAGTKHGGVNYAALVESQDQQVGRLLDFLDDPNHDGDKSDSLVTNTVVFFTSDNGGHEGATDNAPLRAHKGTHYEGGLRVPLIVRHTGTVPAGQMTDTPVHAVDFYPTFLDLSGAPAPTNQVLDGTSFAAHLMAPGAHPRHRPPMFYHFPGYLDERARPCSVIIKEVNGARYKLIYNYDYAYDPVPSDDGIKILTQPWELYNLTEDLSEARNLIDGTYSGSLLEGAIADELAGDLVAWLTQATPGWNAKQPTVRATGATVPYPPGDVPDIPPPGGQPFRVTHTDVNQAARQVTLTWNSETGFRYLIWGSSNLWDWSLLLTNINPSGAVTAQTLTDLNIGDHPRYYRVEVRRP